MPELDETYLIRSTEALRAIIPEPPELLRRKVFAHIIDDARAFIAESPLLLMCTADASGAMDVSPKGDAPGFVRVEDETQLTIPDRPGNRLAFGFNNLLENPQISLLFLRPGTRETLRINGSAVITRDPALLASFTVNGKPALLCTRVTVRECFFHCGKALIRSGLWQPEQWDEPRDISFGRQFAEHMGGDPEAAPQVDAAIAEDYRNNLY